LASLWASDFTEKQSGGQTLQQTSKSSVLSDVATYLLTMIEPRQAFYNVAVAAAAVARARTHLENHPAGPGAMVHGHWMNGWDGWASNFPINIGEMGPGSGEQYP
jgi:hypothetical protein